MCEAELLLYTQGVTKAWQSQLNYEHKVRKRHEWREGVEGAAAKLTGGELQLSKTLLPAVVHRCFFAAPMAELFAWLRYKCYAQWSPSRPQVRIQVITLPASDSMLAWSNLTRPGRCSAVSLQERLPLATGTYMVRSVNKRMVDLHRGCMCPACWAALLWDLAWQARGKQASESCSSPRRRGQVRGKQASEAFSSLCRLGRCQGWWGCSVCQQAH